MLSPSLFRRFQASISQGSGGIPKGELWLGTDLFCRAGMPDTVESHLRLAGRLGHSVVCLPVSETAGRRGPGYRYFGCEDVRTAVAASDSPVFAVVDGPFQRLADERGLMALLLGWTEDREELLDAYAARSMKTLELISRIAELRVSAVVIADDLSADQGPLLRPADVETLFGGFHTRAVRIINESGAAAFFHSCGKLDKLLPMIRSWRLDGLAAIQTGANDIACVRAALDSDVLILGGIELEWLESETLGVAERERLFRVVEALGPSGRWIVGTSCGFYWPEREERLRELYRLIEGVLLTSRCVRPLPSPCRAQ